MHLRGEKFGDVIYSIWTEWTQDGMLKSHDIQKHDVQNTLKLIRKLNYLQWEALIMVVGEDTFVNMGPLEIFGPFMQQIKTQDAGYLYVLAMKDLNAISTLVRTISGTAALHLLFDRIKAFKRDIAAQDRAEMTYLYYLQKLQEDGRLKWGNKVVINVLKKDPYPFFMGASSGYSMALRMGIPWVHLVMALPEIMLQKFGVSYTFLIPDVPLQAVAFDPAGWSVLGVVLNQHHRLLTTPMRMSQLPPINHYGFPDYMSSQIDKAAKEWVCRSSGVYGLSPTNDTVPLVQWRTVPSGNLPPMMSPEVHQGILKVMKEEMGINCYKPTREEFSRAYSPFWTHAESCYGVLRDRADQAVLNPHFLQYFLSKTLKYATHVRHAELTNRC